MAFVYNGIADIFKNQRNYYEALKNYFAALKINEYPPKQNFGVSYYPNKLN